MLVLVFSLVLRKLALRVADAFFCVERATFRDICRYCGVTEPECVHLERAEEEIQGRFDRGQTEVEVGRWVVACACMLV